jgi:hypothetical protein
MEVKPVLKYKKSLSDTEGWGRPVTRYSFGMSVLHPENAKPYGAWDHYPQTPIEPIGYGCYRIWDNDVTWRQIERMKGVFDWSRLDAIVSLLKRNELKPLYVLGQVPNWASGGKVEHTRTPSVRYSALPPKSLEDWILYCRAVARRYRGLIEAYEVWNEFDLPQFWSGTDQQMELLVKTAADTIRREDPAAQIVSPSVSANKGRAFDRLVALASSQRSSIDAIAVHTYNRRRPFDVDLDVQCLRDMLSGHHLASVPIWVTEFNDLGNVSDSPSLSAGRVVKSFLCNLCGGADRAYWWQLGHPTARSLLVDPKCPAHLTVAGRALATLIKNLSGRSISRIYRSENDCQVILYRGERVAARIAWCQPGTFSPMKLGARDVAYDISGRAITPSAASKFSETPTYIFEQTGR